MAKLESMKCPDCGSQLHFDDEQDFCYCSHCGAQVFKDSKNNVKIEKTVIHRNEARIIEAENRIKELEFKEREQKRKFRFYLVITILATSVLGAIIYGIYLLFKNYSEEISRWGWFASIFIGMIVIYYIIFKYGYGRRD
jgi:ribosomal protein S27E